MALLPMLHTFDPRLRKKALPVEAVDRDVRVLIDDLLETNYDLDALGLAAPQAGISKRVMVVDVGEKKAGTSCPFVMVNPEIHWHSPETQVTQEGCFSVPGFYEHVTRSLEIKVSYLDEQNKHQELSASGLLADCIQHELDHLNGVLFIDHLSALRRGIILQKLKKNKRLR